MDRIGSCFPYVQYRLGMGSGSSSDLEWDAMQCIRRPAASTTAGGGMATRRRPNDKEGLAMAGLVGILRQLGDLAELAAEVFDGLQDQGIAVSARGRRLAVRANHLQADLQLLAGRRLCWHPRLKVSHGVVAGGDAPRFIANHIKRCRGPPRLSALDRFDAHGEGACLKRYTNPSFFRTVKLHHQACAPPAPSPRPNGYLNVMKTRPPEFQGRDIHSKPPDSAPIDDCKSEKAAASLSMLRQLEHRQTAGCVSPALKLQMQQSCCIHKYEYSAEQRRDSSADHSETDDMTSFTSSCSPAGLDMEMNKQAEESTTGQSKDDSPNCCSDAGSGYVGRSCSELERTSSFEAWLSPGACSSTPHEYEITTSSRFVSRADTINYKVEQDSAAAETSCNKGVSRRHRYKGSIASRLTSLPGKLCMKLQHDPLPDSWPPSHHAAGGLRSSRITTAAFLPVVLVTDPVFSIQQDSVLPDSEGSYYLHQETTRLQRTGSPPYDASSVDAEIHDQQHGPSISAYQCSNISSSEDRGDPTTYTPDSKQLLFPTMQRTGCMIDGSLHNIKRPTSVLPENSSCQDTKVAPPPLVPIPPMRQWLSVKAHTGPVNYRKGKPFGKDPVRRAEGEVLKTRDLSELAINSYEAWSEPAGTNQQSGAEIYYSQQEPMQQRARADSDKVMQVPASPTEKLDHVSYRKQGPEISSSRGSTLSESEENKHSNATQVDVQNSAASGHGDEGNLRHENVFFSAIEQLATMSPPRVPRPKHPLPEFACLDRVTLRNCPSPIHGSTSILDSRTALLGQIKDKSFSLKPVSGRNSPVSVTGSPTNARVATILQRADDMRQAHADSSDVDGEDSWSDQSD